MIERPKQSTLTDQKLRETQSVEVCNECFGTGTKLIQGKGAVLCPCKRADPKGKLTAAARIPERYSNCSFDTFETKPNTRMDTALLFARSLVDDYPAVDRGLLLMGSVGVGKTHLAVSIIRGLIDRGFACIFSESGSLLKEIQDSYNPISKSSELRVLAPIYEADVLVLDELGATVPTDWVRDTIYQIINRRYNANKLTVFTTNYLDKPRLDNQDASTSPRTFSRKVNAERIREMTTLEDRIGTRLRSRLYEMCTTVLMEGEDYRTHMGRGRFDLTSS
jgi:DNA replication protein DnaC